jgi:hypothetical protein
MEDYPKTLSEFEKRFVSSETCRTTCSSCAGKMVFHARNVEENA